MLEPASAPLPPDDRVLFPIDESPSARQRLLGFLALDHPVFPKFLRVEDVPGGLSAAFRRREGTPLEIVRHSREGSAALFAQAASAVLFFGARGYPLALSDFERATVEVWEGAPHLWLPAPPRSVPVETIGAEEPAPLLAALVSRLFGSAPRRAGRLDSSARKLLDRYLEPFAETRRPDAFLVEIFRAFPFLTEPPFASIRRRCLGFRPHGFDALERAHRGALAAATRRLAGGRPRIFGPGRSSLLPFDALRASLAPRAAAEIGRDFASASRAIERSAETDTDWICVDPDEWDDASRALVEETASRRGIAVDAWTPARAAARPDELRGAVWIAAPDLAASVSLYEGLGAIASRRPARLRGAVHRFVSSPDYASFLARGAPAGSIRESDADAAARDLAALSREERRGVGMFLVHPGHPGPDEMDAVGAGSTFSGTAAKLAEGSWFVEDGGRARWRPADASARADLLAAFSGEERRAFALAWLDAVADPLARSLLALEARRPDLLREAAAAIFGESPRARRPRPLDGLMQAAAASLGDEAPASVRYYHAERLTELGLGDEAKAAWNSIAEDPSCPPSWRRAARARAGRASAAEGDGAAARRLLGAVADDASAAPDEVSAARREMARLATDEGRFDHADALLARCEEDARISDGERLEVVLARAAYHGMRGESDVESAIYEAHRGRIGLSSRQTQFRFLLGEGTALSNRRDHRSAAVRFAEALAAAEEAEEQGAALIDLSVEAYYLGDVAGSEAHLRRAASCLRAAGHAALFRNAIGNLVHLLLETGRDEEAERVIDRLASDAERQGDRKGAMLALAYRSRIALRRGRFRESAAARKEALAACERLGEAIERQELEIDESDARLYSGDAEAAIFFARSAAARPDMGGLRESAASRLSDLERWRSGAPPDIAAIEEEFRTSPIAAAERVARARVYFGGGFETEHAPLVARARAVLAGNGREGLAAAVFSGSAVLDLRRARTLRDEIARDALPLRVVDAEGGVAWRSAEFETAVWRRALRWEGRPLFLEGTGPDPDLATLLFETVRGREEVTRPGEGDASGLAVLRARGIITSDASMELLGDRLARIAPQNVTVFISGESGTGKERIARAVHALSPRAGRAFVAINVAAFPEPLLEDELFGHARGAFTGADRDRMGLFETAHEGTLFLDEIGDLSPALQAKLLRVLQEREIKRVGENRTRSVDVRLVSATAKPLERAVESGAFREDLYYRIKVASLHVPPLRERGADVALLARHFLSRCAAEYGKGEVKLTAAAAGALRAHAWPGNVRELENTIMEAVALADVDGTLDRDVFRHLNPSAGADGRGTYRERVDAFRRKTVAEALARSSGNRTHAARELGLTRQALLYLIRELNIRG